MYTHVTNKHTAGLRAGEGERLPGGCVEEPELSKPHGHDDVRADWPSGAAVGLRAVASRLLLLLLLQLLLIMIIMMILLLIMTIMIMMKIMISKI